MATRSQSSMLPLVATQAMVINTDPDCSWTTDQDMVLVISQDWAVTMVLAGIAGHSDLYGHCDCTALKQQHGFRWHPRSWASTWSFIMAFGGNRDPRLQQDLVPGHGHWQQNTLNVIMALSGQASHPDLHGPSGSIALKHQYVPCNSPVPGHLLGLQW